MVNRDDVIRRLRTLADEFEQGKVSLKSFDLRSLHETIEMTTLEDLPRKLRLPPADRAPGPLERQTRTASPPVRCRVLWDESFHVTSP